MGPPRSSHDFFRLPPCYPIVVAVLFFCPSVQPATQRPAPLATGPEWEWLKWRLVALLPNIFVHCGNMCSIGWRPSDRRGDHFTACPDGHRCALDFYLTILFLFVHPISKLHLYILGPMLCPAVRMITQGANGHPRSGYYLPSYLYAICTRTLWVIWNCLSLWLDDDDIPLGLTPRREPQSWIFRGSGEPRLRTRGMCDVDVDDEDEDEHCWWRSHEGHHLSTWSIVCCWPTINRRRCETPSTSTSTSTSTR